MIFVEAPQGTPAWYQARVGKITASCFADAVSRIGGLDERQEKYVALMLNGMPKAEAIVHAGYKAAPSSDTVRRALMGEDTSAPSDTAKRYAADLAIERISNKPHGEPAKAWVLERGHEMEVRARMLYEVRTKAFITESGICLSDDGIFGYSSDGLADNDGLIEIKAPIDSIKIMDMWRTGDTSEYDHQMQGGLWLTGRRWLDFIMYVPDLATAGKDLFVKRIYRDEEFIDKMVRQLADFDRLVNDYTVILRADTKPITTIEEHMQTETAPAPAPLDDLKPTPAAELIAAQANPAGAELSRPAQALLEKEGAENFVMHHRPPTLSEQVASGKWADGTPVPPTLKLGDIGKRLGFDVRADFLLSLGFAPAATDKNSKLFHESDFPLICAALLRHIGAIEAQFSTTQ